MYTRTYYNAFKNRLYCVEIEDGKRRKIDFHPTISCYIPDNTGSSDIKDIYGNPVTLQTFSSKKEMKETASFVKTCESDIPEDIKFLHKRYENKDLKVNMGNFQVATIDLEMSVDDKFPEPDKAEYPINLITVHYSKENQVYTFGLYPYTGNDETVKNYHYCPDEKTMLERFIKHWRKKSPDIVTGWNITAFDIPYLVNRCENLGIEISLSPINQVEPKKWSGYHIDSKDGYLIGGIAQLDGLDLFKNYERERQVSYSLQNIGTVVVGEGKKDYEGTLNNLWKQDWNSFVEYNVQDVLLVLGIENEKKYIPLTIRLCYQTLIPFERVFSTISLIEGYVLKVLHEENTVLPDMEFKPKTEKFDGAHVFANPGYYRYCMSYDVESLYPNMVIFHNISLETLRLNDDRFNKTPLSDTKTWKLANGEKTYGGIYYDKSKIGVLPKIVSRILEERKKLKRKMFIASAIENNRNLDTYDKELVAEVQKENESALYYKSQQYVRKIFANSVFGAAGCEYFHLYDLNNAISITLCGQDLIKFLYNSLDKFMRERFHLSIDKYFPNIKSPIKQLTKPVTIQGDTDSAYLCFDELIENLGLKFTSNQEFYDWANEFDKKFLEPFFNKILKLYAQKYNTDHVINFKREKIITQRIVTAKKKYVDEILANEDELYINEPKISVTGIEIVRTDTPAFCRKKLKQAVKTFFESKFENKEFVVEEIRKIEKEFKNEKITNIAIPRGVSDYTKYAKDESIYLKNGLTYPKSCPIHVRASINYNYLRTKYKLQLAPITNGTKIKFVHVKQNNEIYQDVIGFINEYPKEFEEIFKIDYDRQFERSFTSVLQRFFDVLKWGTIQLESNTLDQIIEF